MKRETVIATLLYGLLIFLLLFGFYLFLRQYGFSEKNFLIGGGLLLLLSILFAYILSDYILSKKFKVDDRLLHITKEILHELNMPLATIYANSNLLKKSLKEKPRNLKRLNRIEASATRLYRLYSELVYSIKKEILPIEKEMIQLDKLIEERIDAMKLLERNSFVLELDSLTIFVDKIGFEKMFDNIITNAMKYSEKSSSIIIRLKENILEIQDYGIGMDETELLSIYERYYQLDHHIYGEGIGLALVKAFCEESLIKMWIDSKKNSGTSIFFNLEKVIVIDKI